MRDLFLALVEARRDHERVVDRPSPAIRSANAGIRLLEGLADRAEEGRQRELALAQLSDYRELLGEARVC